MTTGTRIPQGIDDFNSYHHKTASYIKTGTPEINGIRLGLLQPEIDGWCAISNIWDPLYEKYTDKKNSRTSAVIEQLHQCIITAVDYDMEINMLDRIAASINATVTDLITFNIKKGLTQKTTRTISHTPIAEPVEPILLPIGGGTVNIKCYSTTGARASIYEDANCVQYLYLVGNTSPESIKSEGLKQEITSRASFSLPLGAENSGKMLFIYFRWYNTKHPELAGPWSTLQSTIIL